MNYAGKYLTVKLKNECYGIPILQVKEILRYQSIHSIPNMPDYIAGVLNLRGKVITIMDLRKRFGFSAEILETTCIVVVNGIQTMGLVVDAVDEVLYLSDKEVEEQRFGFADYVTALGKHTSGIKILLDVKKLNQARIAVDVEI
jgi:purine-binding chemotaxis protein CheW